MKRQKDRFGFYYNTENNADELMFLLLCAFLGMLLSFPEVGLLITFILGAAAAGELYTSQRQVGEVLRYGLRLAVAYIAIPVVWLIASIPTISVLPIISVSEIQVFTWARLGILLAATYTVYVATAFGMAFALWIMNTSRNGHTTENGNNHD